MGRLSRASSIVCFSTALMLMLGVQAAAQGENEADEVAFTAQDAEGIKALLGALSAAMLASDANAIAPLLSPNLSEAERSRLISYARSEFEKLSYTKFAFDLEGDLSPEFIGADQIKIVVPVRYAYESQVEGEGMADEEGNAYEFRFIKGEAGWGIADSDMFGQFAGPRLDRIIGWIFLGGFLGALVLFFWGWMALDVWTQTKQVRLTLLLILSTPAGAGLYFFAVYLRRRFMTHGDQSTGSGS